MATPVHVTSGSVAGGTWRIATRPPHPLLREHVWNLAGYEEEGQPARRHELPFGGAVLVVNLGPALGVGLPARGVPVEPFGSFMAGVHDAPALTAHPGRQAGVQAYLSPLGAHALLALGLHELANRTVALDHLLGPDARRLEERIAAAPGWPERLDALEAMLLARIAAGPVAPPDLEHAWRLLRASGGRLEIGALAAHLGCSRRHLSARFRDGIGLPPKVVARVLRFRAVVDALPAAGPVDWARIAADGGYADQSHLIRDFRAFAGTSPGAYLRSREPAYATAADVA